MGNYYKFRVKDKFYLYNIYSGEIFSAESYNDKITDAFEGEQKDLIIRDHVPISEEDWKKGKVLNKMVFSIAHTCNMCCAYCFADGGTFGSKAFMSKKMVKDAIDYFFNYASKSAKKYNISFMGGEPLTNLDVFYFAVDYINSRAKEIKIPIRYTITTNATIINEKILDYIIKNNMHINFSIDGNRGIHDLNRKYVNGNGSFDIVMNTLEILKNHNYYNMTARMTITKPGIKTLCSDIKFLWDSRFYYIYFDLVKTSIKELAVDNSDICGLKEQLFELLDSNIYLDRMKEGRFVRNFSDKEYLIDNKQILRECSYYNTNMLEVTPEGDFYKCPYTVGNIEHQCGNIYSGVEWTRYTGVFEISELCKSCWAKRLCGGGCGIDRDVVRCNYIKIIYECALKHYIMKKTMIEK
jgi:uncharacterized protein